MSYPPPEGPYQEVPPPPAPEQRRRGCRGCVLGCLATFVVIAILAVVVVAAGLYMLRQTFPTSGSIGDAATCAILRVAVNNAETAIQQSDASAADKAELQRGFQELRAQYDQKCAPPR